VGGVSVALQAVQGTRETFSPNVDQMSVVLRAIVAAALLLCGMSLQLMMPTSQSLLIFSQTRSCCDVVTTSVAVLKRKRGFNALTESGVPKIATGTTTPLHLPRVSLNSSRCHSYRGCAEDNFRCV